MPNNEKLPAAESAPGLGSALDAALAYADVGQEPSMQQIDATLAMCEFCQSREDVNGAALRILAAEVRRLRGGQDCIEKEQTRWQDAIHGLCCKLAPEANIDGGGCDSGDPLDFSLSEIAQALNHHSK